MKFDELCDFVLVNESDIDYITGKDKVFSLSDKAEDILDSYTQKDMEELVRKTKLPITLDYLTRLIIEGLNLPQEKGTILSIIKDKFVENLGSTEFNAKKAAAIIFADMKRKKVFVSGIPSTAPEDIDKLSAELEKELATSEEDEPEGLSYRDVERFGGSLEHGRSHPEDESEWY